MIFSFDIFNTNFTIQFFQNIHFDTIQNWFVKNDAFDGKFTLHGEYKGKLMTRYCTIDKMANAKTDDLVDLLSIR